MYLIIVLHLNRNELFLVLLDGCPKHVYTEKTEPYIVSLAASVCWCVEFIINPPSLRIILQHLQ